MKFISGKKRFLSCVFCPRGKTIPCKKANWKRFSICRPMYVTVNNSVRIPKSPTKVKHRHARHAWHFLWIKSLRKLQLCDKVNKIWLRYSAKKNVFYLKKCNIKPSFIKGWLDSSSSLCHSRLSIVRAVALFTRTPMELFPARYSRNCIKRPCIKRLPSSKRSVVEVRKITSRNYCNVDLY